MNHDINPLHHYAAMNLLEGIYRELKSQGWDMRGSWATAAERVLRESCWMVEADEKRTAAYSDFNRVMEFAAVICDELSINATNDPYCQAAMHCAAVIRAKKK